MWIKSGISISVIRGVAYFVSSPLNDGVASDKSTVFIYSGAMIGRGMAKYDKYSYNDLYW